MKTRDYTRSEKTITDLQVLLATAQYHQSIGFPKYEQHWLAMARTKTRQLAVRLEREVSR